MYTRETLARRVAEAAAVYKIRSRIMAAFSVIGGLGQLWIHPIIQRRYERSAGHRIELAIFAAYIVIFLALLVWMNKGVNAVTPKCEACGAKLKDMSGRMAMATGKCDQCGAQVIE